MLRQLVSGCSDPKPLMSSAEPDPAEQKSTALVLTTQPPGPIVP